MGVRKSSSKVEHEKTTERFFFPPFGKKFHVVIVWMGALVQPTQSQCLCEEKHVSICSTSEISLYCCRMISKDRLAASKLNPKVENGFMPSWNIN